MYVKPCHSFTLLCYCSLAFDLNITMFIHSTKMYGLVDVYCAHVTVTRLLMWLSLLFNVLPRLVDVFTTGVYQNQITHPRFSSSQLRKHYSQAVTCQHYPTPVSGYDLTPFLTKLQTHYPPCQCCPTFLYIGAHLTDGCGGAAAVWRLQ
jgi:hypothetical protein